MDIQNIPKIIAAAGTSNLGIFALMLSAISGLALTFFRNSSESIKITIFLLLLGGVSAFGYSINQQVAADEDDEIVTAFPRKEIKEEHIPKKEKDKNSKKNIIVKQSKNSQVVKKISVTGNEQWTSTELNVENGAKVEFTAKGTVILTKTKKNIKKGTSTPDGISDKKWITKYSHPLEGKNIGLLIGKISQAGEIFTVGKSASITAKNSGEIFLGINDKKLRDNQGFYKVEITVYNGQ